MNNKKILFVCAGLGGGISKIIRFVSESCIDNFEKVYLLHRGRENVNDIPHKEIIEIISPINQSEGTLLWRYEHILQIRNEIKRIAPNIVCCFGTEQCCMVAMAMIGLRDIKLVLCDRGDPYTLPRMWKIISKWAFNQASNCIFQLKKQGEWYGEKVMDRSVVIPNAYFSSNSVIPHVGVRKKTIVSVGRFVYEKRYEVLIEAFKIVYEKHPEYRLIIYGDGPYKNRYHELLEKYNLINVVELPGYTNNSASAINDAGVFVLSSLYEGIPNSLIEAMAIGVPTVSTNCTPGGPDFLTDHGKRGLLVPVNDVKALADNICQIIEQPSLGITLSQRGQEIINILDKDKIKKKWLNFLCNI
ncbi:MAG: glycosyltransferase family 4 protein [Lentimicrobiaceae bacterium]|nr:glycosyltransferase family 4 protein [Lentimicrobiaceae bacterium]